MSLNVPTRHNDKLRQVVARINQDVELEQLWRCVNINAVDRSGISDHGATHVRIMANAALKLLRLLVEAGITTSVEANYGLTQDDAEVIVVLASCLHDLGIAIHRDNHEQYSLVLATPKLKQLLDGVYAEKERTIITAEVLHAIIAHHWDQRCLTVEAGVVKVADALDMTQGRSRIPFEAGETNIHSVSAAAIDAVSLQKGERVPIRIEIAMSNSAGIFQVDELLKLKLRNSSIASYVEVVARIEGETEKRLIEFYTL
ncbi:MAG: HD domain-containing protein [Chloroflexota bacterium]|nr:HD domain-containing protein [Chloroflexota bacterium]